MNINEHTSHDSALLLLEYTLFELADIAEILHLRGQVVERRLRAGAAAIFLFLHDVGQQRLHDALELVLVLELLDLVFLELGVDGAVPGLMEAVAVGGEDILQNALLDDAVLLGDEPLELVLRGLVTLLLRDLLDEVVDLLLDLQPLLLVLSLFLQEGQVLLLLLHGVLQLCLLRL